MQALADYNTNPYDIDLSKLTFHELYESWSNEQYPKMKSGLKKSYTAAYKHCKPLYDIQYKSIRKLHMQRCIDSCERGHATKANIKLLFIQLDKYAYDQDIISKCYSKNVEIGEKPVSDKHKPFSDEEVQALWKIRGKPYVDDTLFMLYTGCRMSEMLQMKCGNINLEENYMVGGIKTKNGINRIIPIHSDLLPIIHDHISENEYLFDYRRSDKSDDPEKALAKLYGSRWTEAMKNWLICGEPITTVILPE